MLLSYPIVRYLIMYNKIVQCGIIQFYSTDLCGYVVTYGGSDLVLDVALETIHL